ncbi:MAG TPA: hypothetical protein DEF43_13335 [Chloroflexus aurantiacus]|nr:MAG: hypothetical protein D6716_16195 [Chloroflexota bacterium]HBW68118.1 hypothetical protein [Chloroflexus aurantiacus]
MPYPFVIHVSWGLECGSHAHDPARVTLITLLVAGTTYVLVTIIWLIVSDSICRSYRHQVHIWQRLRYGRSAKRLQPLPARSSCWMA